MHRVAACEVVERVKEAGKWNERKLNIPGIGNIPLVAAMSNSRLDEERQILDMRNNHTSFGMVNGREVELLRDIGTSVSIVRTEMVEPEQYTGKITCVLVDHCVKKCPQAVVDVDTAFYSGKLPVVCMDRCTFDLIIGNGARVCHETTI